MQARQIASFVLGFAAGLICLCLVLWATGALRVGPPSPFQQTALAGPAVPAPSAGDLAARAAQQQPRRPVNPPPFEAGGNTTATAAPDKSATTGDADRYAFNTDGQLAMPIAGLNPLTLHDTFSDARTGHMHEALDIPADRNTPVHAVVEGKVAKLFNSKQGGTTVYQFDDSGTYCYYYAHLDHYAPGIREGMLLHKGEVLGYVGSTGDASPNAPHLHLAVFRLGPEKHWWKGDAVDPLPLLKQSVQQPSTGAATTKE